MEKQTSTVSTPSNDYPMPIKIRVEYKDIISTLERLGFTIEKITIKLYTMTPYDCIEKLRYESYHIAYKGERPYIIEDEDLGNTILNKVDKYLVTNVFNRLLSESLITNMINTLG